MAAPSLISIQVGVPVWLGVPGAAAPADRPWRTAFLKHPIAGPVRLGRAGLAGDSQADRRHHGGPEMAVLAYAAAHYPDWWEELGLDELAGGENGAKALAACASLSPVLRARLTRRGAPLEAAPA